MRYEIELELKEKILPLDYRRNFISFFKKILADYNQELKNLIYNKSDLKNFTYSLYLPIEKIEEEKIFLKFYRIKLFLSTEDIMLSLHFLNAFLEAKSKKIYLNSENLIEIIKIKKIQEKEIKDNYSTFKILSPIVIREHTREKDFYHLLDEKGIKVLKKNIIFNLKDNFPISYLEEIEIIPIETKKTVVSFYGLKMQVTLGVIGIRANKKILTHFYKCGLGSKRSAGFSMLDLID